MTERLPILSLRGMSLGGLARACEAPCSGNMHFDDHHRVCAYGSTILTNPECSEVGIELASSPYPFLRGGGERAWYTPTAHCPFVPRIWVHPIFP